MKSPVTNRKGFCSEILQKSIIWTDISAVDGEKLKKNKQIYLERHHVLTDEPRAAPLGQTLKNNYNISKAWDDSLNSSNLLILK